MKRDALNKFKGMVYRLALVAVLLLGLLTVCSMTQGTLGLLPGVGLLLAELLVLNAVCGLLLPAQAAQAPSPARLQAAARRVPMQGQPVLRVVRGGGDGGRVA